MDDAIEMIDVVKRPTRAYTDAKDDVPVAALRRFEPTRCPKCNATLVYDKSYARARACES